MIHTSIYCIFCDHVLLQQSASRSHISVTSLLSGKVCCSNLEASLFPVAPGQLNGSWQCYNLWDRAAPSALSHLSSDNPHTAIWSHLSQLEEYLLFLQQQPSHAASAMRTQIVLSLTWACFFFFLNPKHGNISQLKLNAKLVSEMVTACQRSWWDITTYFKRLSFRRHHFQMVNLKFLPSKSSYFKQYPWLPLFLQGTKDAMPNKTAWSHFSNVSIQQQRRLPCLWWERSQKLNCSSWKVKKTEDGRGSSGWFCRKSVVVSKYISRE